MSPEAARTIDKATLEQFFHAHAIDEFAIIPPQALQAPPGRRPSDIFPACRTMILFGRVMGDDLFIGDVSRTAPKTTAFKQELAGVSRELAGMLTKSGSQAVAVNTLVVKDGKLKGSLSLKHCARDAGLGEIGDNGLLLSPKFGIRLGLGAVLTDQEISPTPPGGDPVSLCTHCGLCTGACPTNAFEGGSLDSFRCKNITGAIPGPFAVLFERLMGTKAMEPLLTSVANRVASRNTVRCSACLMACPFFTKYAGK